MSYYISVEGSRITQVSSSPFEGAIHIDQPLEWSSNVGEKFYYQDGLLLERPKLDVPDFFDLGASTSISIDLPKGTVVRYGDEQIHVEDGVFVVELDGGAYSLQFYLIPPFPIQPKVIEVTKCQLS